MTAKIELILGGRSLGCFTRADLLELRAVVESALDMGSEKAMAWLALKLEDRERIKTVIEAVGAWFLQDEPALGALTGRARRVCAGLVQDYVTAATDEAVAGLLRIKPAQVQASRRWLKAAEDTEGGLARTLHMVRRELKMRLRRPS